MTAVEAHQTQYHGYHDKYGDEQCHHVLGDRQVKRPVFLVILAANLVGCGRIGIGHIYISVYDGHAFVHHIAFLMLGQFGIHFLLVFGRQIEYLHHLVLVRADLGQHETVLLAVALTCLHHGHHLFVLLARGGILYLDGLGQVGARETEPAVVLRTHYHRQRHTRGMREGDLPAIPVAEMLED